MRASNPLLLARWQVRRAYQETPLRQIISAAKPRRHACSIRHVCICKINSKQLANDGQIQNVPWPKICRLSSGPNICALFRHEQIVSFFHIHQQSQDFPTETLSKFLFSPNSVANHKLQVPESKFQTCI